MRTVASDVPTGSLTASQSTEPFGTGHTYSDHVYPVAPPDKGS